MKISNLKSQISNRAFTLIELLVVIAIIGILAAIALVSFTGAQRQARDVSRKSDIKQLSTAITQYASKNKGKYPSYTSAVGIDTLCSKLGLTTCPNDTELSYTYISNGNGGGGPTATEYLLWADMENTQDYFVVCSSGGVGNAISEPSSYTCPSLNVTTPPEETSEPTLPPEACPYPACGEDCCTSFICVDVPAICTSSGCVCGTPPPAGTAPPTPESCLNLGEVCQIDGDTPCCKGLICKPDEKATGYICISE